MIEQISSPTLYWMSHILIRRLMTSIVLQADLFSLAF